MLLFFLGACFALHGCGVLGLETTLANIKAPLKYLHKGGNYLIDCVGHSKYASAACILDGKLTALPSQKFPRLDVDADVLQWLDNATTTLPVLWWDAAIKRYSFNAEPRSNLDCNILSVEKTTPGLHVFQTPHSAFSVVHAASGVVETSVALKSGGIPGATMLIQFGGITFGLGIASKLRGFSDVFIDVEQPRFVYNSVDSDLVEFGNHSLSSKLLIRTGTTWTQQHPQGELNEPKAEQDFDDPVLKLKQVDSQFTGLAGGLMARWEDGNISQLYITSNEHPEIQAWTKFELPDVAEVPYMIAAVKLRINNANVYAFYTTNRNACPDYIPSYGQSIKRHPGGLQCNQLEGNGEGLLRCCESGYFAKKIMYLSKFSKPLNVYPPAQAVTEYVKIYAKIINEKGKQVLETANTIKDHGLNVLRTSTLRLQMKQQSRKSLQDNLARLKNYTASQTKALQSIHEATEGLERIRGEFSNLINFQRRLKGLEMLTLRLQNAYSKIQSRNQAACLEHRPKGNSCVANTQDSGSAAK